ncbi:MAG: GGDEF domain-containing protein [Acidobacteriales bacterium]|nr:GGDEF domain-containing protein [Terriglobales bacterium]
MDESQHEHHLTVKADESEESRLERESQLRVRSEIKRLEQRDLQLWSIAILVVLVLAAGIAALLMPGLMFRLGAVQVQGSLLPQLFFALITLVILFNIYILQQRRALHQTREELVRQVVYNEAATRLSMVDPLTDTFNRRYMDQILSKDLKRADRLGIKLGFVMIDINNFKTVNTRFGHLVGDQVLVEVAQVLKQTFRASDIVMRYGGDEFLVILNDTDEAQSALALDRLQKAVDRWNVTGRVKDYEMALSWGVEVYSKGANFHDVLDAADRKMYEHKRSREKDLAQATSTHAN